MYNARQQSALNVCRCTDDLQGNVTGFRDEEEHEHRTEHDEASEQYKDSIFDVCTRAACQLGLSDRLKRKTKSKPGNSPATM